MDHPLLLMPHLQPYHLAKLLTSIRRRMKRTLRRILRTILPTKERILKMDNYMDDVIRKREDREEEDT
ncbi:hypothetical protein Tco_1275657 [Tanacetum coccineum]